MKQYKRMAEIAKTGLFMKLVDVDDPHCIPIPNQDRKVFWERYEQARIFVFSGGGWLSGPKTISISEEPDLDVPFHCCFFENLPDEKGEEWMVTVGDNGGQIIACLLYELEPHRYDMYFLARNSGVALDRHLLFLQWEPGCGNAVAWLNQLWLDKLNRSSLGVEHVNEKVKVGSGTGEKRFHKIRHIIRVVPHAMKGKAAPAFSREVDWSHRWSVRGHWRRHEGLGKNRAGEYCVEGFTWVTEHVRGPEDAPLIEKVRFVPAATVDASPDAEDGG